MLSYGGNDMVTAEFIVGEGLRDIEQRALTFWTDIWTICFRTAKVSHPRPRHVWRTDNRTVTQPAQVAQARFSFHTPALGSPS
eukprot:8579599-Pyramimonas_sp.AAC.2